MRKLNMAAAFSLIAMLFISACHTTAGAGKDISAAGNAITKSANKHAP